MTVFDPNHLSWPFVFFPGLVIAAGIAADNKFRGPYFALANVAFGDVDSGYPLTDRTVIDALVRRIAYLFGAGMLLEIVGYKVFDIASVFFVAGFLLIWPAYLRPLPRYTRNSDWEVLSLWVLYVISCVLFGLIGAAVPPLVYAITKHSVGELIRDNLITLIVFSPVVVIVTTLNFVLKRPLRSKIQDRTKRL